MTQAITTWQPHNKNSKWLTNKKTKQKQTMQQANTCIVLIQGNEKLSPRHWNTGLVVSSGVSLTSWGEVVSLALAGQPSSDGIAIKNTFGVDVYYIDQSHTLSFPIGLVETESDFIVSSVETGLGRWALVVAVIFVDANTFWLSQTWPVILRTQE